MLTVKENLITVLETFCPENVYLQGSINPDETYPDTFITFFITSSNFDAFYDDEPNKIDWSGAVMIYSNDPETLSELSLNVTAALKAAGFLPQGVGNDIQSDVETHTGWAIDFLYQENFSF